MYYAYVLLSLKDDKRYYGMTNSIERRLAEHNNGKVRSTKHRRPLKLVYYEEFKFQFEARDRETYFKSRVGRRFLTNRLGPVV